MTIKNDQEFVFYSDKLNYKTIDGVKGKEYFVEGYISTGDLDLVNDVVTKSCMDSMLEQFDGRSIKLDFEHESFRGKSKLDAEANKTRLPLGKAVDKSRDEKGVIVKWQMNPTWKKFDEKGNVTMTFKDIWSNVESEMLDAFSIAYVPTKTMNEDREGKSVRLLDDVNLLNVALTGNPINPMATMSAVMAKSLEFMKSKEGADMENIEIKNREKKSYQEDGKHIHTDEKPMGVHNHPEIEQSIASLREYVHDLSEIIHDIKYATDNPEESTILKDKKLKGYKQMVKTKDNEPDAGAATPKPEEGAKPEEGKPAANVEGEEGAETNAPEGEQKGFKELKSVVDGLVTEVKDLRKENADLKAIVEKPLQKAKGAENKSQTSQAGTEANSFVGPIDLI